MHHLVYVSSAVNLFTDEQLEVLLEVSRRNNGKRGITGLLLYLGGNFIQVLEGEEKDVLETHQRIEKDTRHTGLITLMQGPVEKREFNEWSMGFRRIDPGDAKIFPGYSDFLDQRANSQERRSACLRILDTFKNINR